MQGRVISFDKQSKRGEIIDKADNRYVFSADDWQGNVLPQTGDNVEFVIDASSEINIVTSVNQTAISNETNNPYEAPTASLNDQKFAQNIETLYAKEANYNMIDWFKKCLRNYANFKGRARCKEYWYFILVYIILTIIAMLLDHAISKITGIDWDWGIIDTILSLALLIPNIAVATRRLHDIGKSGWWQLLWFIPIIGWIIINILLAIETKPEPNRFGLPAKPVRAKTL